MKSKNFILPLLLFFSLQLSAETAILNEPLKVLHGPEKDVDVVVFNPEGTQLYAGGWDNKIFIYDWPSGNLNKSFTAHQSAVLDIQFSKDGQYFMTASNDNTARLWRTSDHKIVHTLSDHNRPVNSAAISPDNRFVITASSDGKIYIYDRNDEYRQVTSIDLSGDEGKYVTFEPNRGMIVQATSRSTAYMLQPGSLNSVREFTHNAGVNHVYFTEDGSRVITASDDRTAIVWDPVSDSRVTTLEGHGWRVLSAQLDEKGETAVTSSNDGEARLWDVATGTTIRIFEPNPPTVIRSAVFSPDLYHVITTGRIRQPGQPGIMIWETGLFDEKPEPEMEANEEELDLETDEPEDIEHPDNVTE